MATVGAKTKKKPTKRLAATTVATKMSPPVVEATNVFAPHTRVVHRTFGTGVVVAVDGDKLEIKFNSVGLKTILDSYVKID